MKEFFKERVNYTKDGEYYTGYLVNLPQVIAQAKSKQVLQSKLLTFGKEFLRIMEESLDRGFEMREFDKDEWIGLTK